MFGAKWVAGAVTGAMMALGAIAANAYTIDFTSAGTGTSGSLFGGSVTWNMTASGILNNSQLFDGVSTAATTASGLSFQTDGYGVGRTDDEITTFPNGRMEWIRVTFSAPVMVNALYFLDLFKSADGSSLEEAYATFSPTGSTQVISAVDTFNRVAGGFASTSFSPILTNSIFFTVRSSNDNVGFADGALAGIGLAPVPVPAAGLLLIGGLGGLAALKRRRKAA
ncbi:MAG TPA: VPLPA-CTERM sorting domain-containing protein [Albidovulum sp.]|uniref:VPLPA-CTERM sorting domain-containing protein n=1 Tax=Albidovulum sp. TaxID=1872424 RepID=UPI002C7E76BA|nr:VPLPA-CTERM sorting domain-containing protein [Albidovulum sp.]